MINKCQKCGEMKECHEHHILPKGIRTNNISIEEGKRVVLCLDCHKKIHILLKIVVRDYTLKWLDNKL